MMRSVLARMDRGESACLTRAQAMALCWWQACQPWGQA